MECKYQDRHQKEPNMNHLNDKQTCSPHFFLFSDAQNCMDDDSHLNYKTVSNYVNCIIVRRTLQTDVA